MAEAIKRYAVVTGGNRGIGLEVCTRLASNGVTVILTAKNKKNGPEAVEKLLNDSGLTSDRLIFHRLDVVDPTSILPLADFIRTQFGKLDMLVNNAGIPGAIFDLEAF